MPVKTVMLASDIFLPDSIPVVDELIMTIIFFDRIQKFLKASEFIRKHKVLFTVIVIAIIVLLIFLVRIFLKEYS